MSDTAPRYIFLGLFVVVIGLLAAIWIHHKHTMPQEPPINGAGSTFVNPLMVQWSNLFEKTEGGCRVGYKSIGSGGGIDLFIAKKVDFACSEAPLTDMQLSGTRSSGDEAIHVPLVLGAVVPAYNLPTVKATLQFTGPILADIYLGKIKNWNELPAECCPGAKLPDLAILVVHRSDSSGTTNVWTDYLSKVSKTWKDKPGLGVGTIVQWPAGIAEDGNKGVAEKVHATPGSIGYVELTYAYRLDLAFGLVKNGKGEYVKASLASVTRAADNALAEMTIPPDLRFSLTDAPGSGSYPIVGMTWAIVRSNQPAKNGQDLVRFLTWAIGDGQHQVEDLLYSRLPKSLVERAEAKIAEIKVSK